ALTYTIKQTSAKLADSRHARSNVTQERRILTSSGLNQNTWTGMLWSVYHRTDEQKGRLARPMAWFFTALREEVRERTTPAYGTSLLASLTEHLGTQQSDAPATRPAPPSRFPPLPQDTQAEPLWQAVLD